MSGTTTQSPILTTAEYVSLAVSTFQGHLDLFVSIPLAALGAVAGSFALFVSERSIPRPKLTISTVFGLPTLALVACTYAALKIRQGLLAVVVSAQDEKTAKALTDYLSVQTNKMFKQQTMWLGVTLAFALAAISFAFACSQPKPK